MVAMGTATVAVEGTDNNQLKGATEEMAAAATVLVAETTKVTVTSPMLASVDTWILHKNDSI
jgi:hypothetical protein